MTEISVGALSVIILLSWCVFSFRLGEKLDIFPLWITLGVPAVLVFVAGFFIH